LRRSGFSSERAESIAACLDWDALETMRLHSAFSPPKAGKSAGETVPWSPVKPTTLRPGVDPGFNSNWAAGPFANYLRLLNNFAFSEFVTIDNTRMGI